MIVGLLVAYGILATMYCVFLIMKIQKYRELQVLSRAAYEQLTQTAELQSSLYRHLLDTFLQPEWVSDTKVVEKVNINVPEEKHDLYHCILKCLQRVDKGWIKRLTPVTKDKLKSLFVFINEEPETEKERIMNLIFDYQEAVNTTVLTSILEGLNKS